MKFLSKRNDSAILAEGIIYKLKGDNSRLREMLIKEQRGFCAYTEKRINRLDSVDVEHFDSTKKGDDDYFNYYATLHEANFRKIKKAAEHEGAAFFSSLFFHDKEELDRRIHYMTEERVYEEAKSGDLEAASFIDFLGFNDNCLYEERLSHLRMLKDIFLCDAKYDKEEMLVWFKKHPEHLSFITAVEAEFSIDLSAIIETL